MVKATPSKVISRVMIPIKIRGSINRDTISKAMVRIMARPMARINRVDLEKRKRITPDLKVRLPRTSILLLLSLPRATQEAKKMGCHSFNTIPMN